MNIRQNDQSQDRINFSGRDYDGLLETLRALIPEKMPEWTDFESEADHGNVLLQLFAHMGDILLYQLDRAAEESFPGSARERESVIRHLRLVGYSLATAAPATVELELIAPPDYEGEVIIKKGDAFATKSFPDRPSIRFEYVRETPLRIKFPFKQNGAAKDPEVRPLIPVEEGQLFRDEYLGESTGEPNQTFVLLRRGAIIGAPGLRRTDRKDIVIETRVAAAGGKPVSQEWTLRETLAYSSGDQWDCIVEIDADDQATIIFGDGITGAVPPVGAEIFATYRVGGGNQGNVARCTITTVIDSRDITLAGIQVNNPAGAVGGAARETITQAVARGPALFRARDRAVTDDDFVALALAFPGVGKARAEALGINRVALYVAPRGGGRMNDVLKADLLNYFEDRRLLSQTIEVEDVNYVPIYIAAEVGIEGYYAQEAVRDAIEEAVQNVLDFENVDFAETLYLSRLYQILESLEGVRYVGITEFQRKEDQTRDASAVDPIASRIQLKRNEIPTIPTDAPEYAQGIKLNFVDEEEEGSS